MWLLYNFIWKFSLFFAKILVAFASKITMGCGQVVRRLILAQEIVGSNPTTPAIQRTGTSVPVFCMVCELDEKPTGLWRKSYHPSQYAYV